MKAFVDAVKSVTKSPATVTIGTVKHVDKQKFTCDVERTDRVEVLEARLSALPGVSGFVLFPKVGSEVILLEIEENAQDCLVVGFSEIDKIQISTTEDLAQVLDDLLQEIQALKFTTNMGPTIQQINQPKFKAIQNRLNKIFQKNGTQ